MPTRNVTFGQTTEPVYKWSRSELERRGLFLGGVRNETVCLYRRALFCVSSAIEPSLLTGEHDRRDTAVLLQVTGYFS